MSTPNEAMTIVRFFHLPIKNEAASVKAGCPKFDDVEMCEIRFSGNKEKIGHFPAHEVFTKVRDEITGEVDPITYAIKYREQYMKFKSGAEQGISGTPLSELPFLTAAKRLELKALNIHTAEALSAVDGPNLKMLGMGGRELKVQAQTYLDNAAGSANVVEMASRLAAQQAQIDHLMKLLQNGTPGEAAVEVEAAENAPVAEPIAAPEDPSASPFAIMEPDDIKNWILEATGEKPRGNLSKAALVAKADEVNAAIAKRRVA